MMNPILQFLKNIMPGLKTFEEQQRRFDNRIGHKSTPCTHPKNKGRGITKASHEESKARRKMAAKSRKINRGK